MKKPARGKQSSAKHTDDINYIANKHKMKTARGKQSSAKHTDDINYIANKHINEKRRAARTQMIYKLDLKIKQRYK